MTERDKDADLKLRSARLFWHMGYVCPTEVAVSAKEIQQGALKRYDLTDLDVVGIKFESDLTFRTIIADCKSGKTSAVSRLFWLRGVMDFFGADHGYLVQPQLGTEVREVALRLKVSLLDRDNLEKYEGDKRLADNKLQYFSLQGYDKEQALWGLKLPKVHKPSESEQLIQRVYTYLSYGYWFNEEYRNIQQLIRVFEDAKDAMISHPDKTRMKVLSYAGLTLWSISLLKMCGAVIATKSSDIHKEARRYIFGGAAGASERTRLMKLFGQISNEPVQLEPPYYGDLLELTARVIKYSHFAKEIPRYADLVAGETIVCGGTDTIEVLLGSEFSLDALKLTKDVAAFMAKATGQESSVFADLMSQ